MDCREVDEVSVLLSNAGGRLLIAFAAGAFCRGGCRPDPRGLEIPVISIFLKLSTSNVGLVGLVAVSSPGIRSGESFISMCSKEMFQRRNNMSTTNPSPILRLPSEYIPGALPLANKKVDVSFRYATHLCYSPQAPRQSHVEAQY